MLKCPFCAFDNEDGALFCEQCKSDLGSVVPMADESQVPMASVIDEPYIPMAPIIASHETVPTAAMEMPMAIAEVMSAPAAVPAVPVPAAPPPAPAASPAPAAAAPATGEATKLPADAKPRLVVLRGQRINVEYPLYDGHNFIGRADEKPVDIDLDDQEPPDRVWCSRQHALVTVEDGIVTIEDLNSANGTYVNRTKVFPGQKRNLAVNDVVQIGTVHMKLKT